MIDKEGTYLGKKNEIALKILSRPLFVHVMQVLLSDSVHDRNLKIDIGWIRSFSLYDSTVAPDRIINPEILRGVGYEFGSHSSRIPIFIDIFIIKLVTFLGDRPWPIRFS